MSVKIYFSGIIIKNPRTLKTKGPLILASNHPNSFLDAILLGALFKYPVHYVVRGDVFKKPLVRKIFTWLKMIPIYRMSEGRENLSLNDDTFERCNAILAAGGTVLIFSEGLCVHEWKLRPLKKGTARLYLQSRFQNHNGHQLRVVPVGLNYLDFSGIGKPAVVNFGNPITSENFPCQENSAVMVNQFNKILESELKNVVLDKTQTIDSCNQIAPNKYIYLFTGILGAILLFPIFSLCSNMAKKLNRGGVFFDSMLFGFLMILAPIYTLTLTLILYIVSGCIYTWLILAIMPFLAYSATRILPQRNHDTVI